MKFVASVNENKAGVLYRYKLHLENEYTISIERQNVSVLRTVSVRLQRRATGGQRGRTYRFVDVRERDAEFWSAVARAVMYMENGDEDALFS